MVIRVRTDSLEYDEEVLLSACANNLVGRRGSAARYRCSGALLVLVLAGSCAAIAQSPDQQSVKGVIYGIATGADRKPAKEITLMSYPIGRPLANRLPETRTDRDGHYRFEAIPWWGKWTVYADDVDAGYSLFTTGVGRPGEEATLSPEHPQAEVNFRLPAPAGSLHIHLTNRNTGAVITGLEVTLMWMNDPDTPIFSGGSDSRRPILVAPGKDLLLHVNSPGFREWAKSAGRGKHIRLASRAHRSLKVQLDPLSSGK